MSERTNRGLSADAVVAVRKRRLGTLPFALALRCCDIGEAQDSTGNVYLTTWGLNLCDTDQDCQHRHRAALLKYPLQGSRGSRGLRRTFERSQACSARLKWRGNWRCAVGAHSGRVS